MVILENILAVNPVDTVPEMAENVLVDGFHEVVSYLVAVATEDSHDGGETGKEEGCSPELELDRSINEEDGSYDIAYGNCLQGI